MSLREYVDGGDQAGTGSDSPIRDAHPYPRPSGGTAVANPASGCCHYSPRQMNSQGPSAQLVRVRLLHSTFSLWYDVHSLSKDVDVL